MPKQYERRMIVGTPCVQLYLKKGSQIIYIYIDKCIQQIMQTKYIMWTKNNQQYWLYAYQTKIDLHKQNHIFLQQTYKNT
jgi:hypothetical protein